MLYNFYISDITSHVNIETSLNLSLVCFSQGPIKSGLNFRTAETFIITSLTNASASGDILYGKLKNNVL